MPNKLKTIALWPVRKAKAIVARIKQYFTRPTIEQLIASDFGIHLGLTVVYGIAFFTSLFTPFVSTTIFFGALFAYCLWLMIKMTPAWDGLVAYQNQREPLVDMYAVA